MAFQPVANTVQVRLQGHHNLNAVENTLYYQYQAGAVPTATELTALAAAIVPDIAAELTQLYTPATTFEQLVLTDLHAPGRAQVTYPISPAIVGASPTDPCPGNSSLGLRRKTGLQGKTNRGRIMLMPMPEPATTGDIITPAQVIKVAALATKLLDVFPRAGGGIWVPAVASFASGVSHIVLSWVFDTILDSMKTRLTGHGS